MTSLPREALAQTYQTWRGENTQGNLLNASAWWNFPNNSTMVFGQQEFDNNVQTTMTNNNGGTVFSTWRWVFKGGASSARTITGDGLRFFDFGGQDGGIYNESSATHVFNVAIEGDGTTDPFQIHLNSTGGLTFGSTVNNQGTSIDILGTAAGAKTVTFSGIVSGSGGMYVNNANATVLFDAANAMTGQLTINAGSVRLNNSGDTFGSTNQLIRIGTGATLDLNGVSTTVGSVAEEGGSDSGSISLGGGTLTVTADSTGSQLYQSSISGTGGLTKLGSHTLNLFGTQSYTGTTTVTTGQLSTSVAMSSTNFTINGGTFSTDAVDRLANNAAVSISSGNFTIGGNDTVGSFTMTGGTLGGSSTLTASTYALQGGTLTGNLGAGTATVTTGTTSLNGTLGATTVNINSGTLSLGANDRLDNGATVTVAGGILDTTGSNRTDTVTTFAMSSGSLNGGGTITAGNYNLSGGTVTANLGTGTMNVTGNTALNGTAGATTVNISAGTLTLGSNNRLADGATVTVSGTGSLSTGTALTDTVTTFNMSAGSLAGTGTLTATTYGLSGGTVTANLGTGTMNVTGNTALNGTAGATTVNVSAGTLTLGSNNRLADGATVTVSGTGSLSTGSGLTDTVGTFNMSAGSLGGSGTLTATTYGLSGGTVTANLGTGTMNVTGNTALNGTAGATAVNVSGSTLTLGSAGRLAAGATLNVTNSGILAIAGAESVTSLVLSNGTLNGTGQTLTASSGYSLNGGTVNANLGTGTATASSGTTTFNGTNTGALTLSGGNVATGGANKLSDSGAVTVNTGTLTFGGSDTVGALSGSGGTVSVGNTFTLTTSFNAASNNYAGTISGSGGLAKSGTGTLTLGGANSYTGATTVSGGVLGLGANDRLSDSTAVTVNGGTLNLSTFNDTVSSFTISSGSLGGSGTLTAATYALQGGTVTGNLGAGTINATASTALNGTAAATTVNVSGAANTLTLGSAGRLASGATVNVTNSGTLALAGAENVTSLVLSNGTLSGTGQTLTASSGYSLNGGSVNANLGAGTATASSGTTTFNGTNTGALTLGGGNVTTGGADKLSDSGAVTVNTGTLTIGGNDTVGALSGSGGTVSVSSGTLTTSFNTASNNYAGTISGAGGFTKAGSGTLSLSGDASGIGTISVSAGRLQVGNGSTTGTIGNDNVSLSSGANLAFNRSDNITYNGVISGSGGTVTKLGSGVLTISNTQTYTGATTVSVGTLSYMGTNTSTATTVQSGGTLAGSGSLGAVTIASGGTLSPGTSPGTLSVGNLTWEGGGNYNWQVYDATGAAGTGYDTISGNSLNITADVGNKFNINLWSLSGIGPDVNGNAINFANSNSYTWTLGSFTNAITNFSAGAFSINTAATNGTAGFNNTFSGTFSIYTTNTTNLVLAYTAATSVYDVTVTSGATNQNLATGGTNLFTGSSALNKLGAGTLIMTNPLNDYTGVTTVKEGTMQINVNAPSGSAGALGNAISAVLVGDSSTNLAAGFNIGVANVTNSRELTVVAGTGAADRIIGTTITSGQAVQAGGITFNTNAVLNAASGGTMLYGGVLAGSGNLTISNSGTSIFTNANTYSGTTTILSGATLRIANNAALGTTAGNTVINSGGTLALSNGITEDEAVTLSGTGVGSGGAIRSVSGNNTLSGNLTLGAASRINSDTGMLILSGGINGANFGLTVGGAGNTTISSNVTNSSGGLTKDGAGSLILSGANTYSGTTTINAGVLEATGGSAIADGGAVSLSNNAGAAFLVSASETIGSLQGGGATGGNVSIASGQTLTVAETGAQTFSGVISNAGGLTKTGAGTTTLSGANTYTGATTVTAGELALGAANVLSDSTAVTVNGGTLNLGANNDTVNSFTISSGTLGGSGGTLTASTYALQGGTVTGNLGAGTATVTTGTTTLNGTLAATTVNVDSGTLSLGSSDRLANSANVTVAGGTLGMGTLNDTVGSFTISSGTLGGTTGTLTASTYALQGGTIDANLGSGTATVTTGTTTLNGTLAATTVNVNSGALNLGSANRLSDSAAVTIAGGTLGMGTVSDTVSSFTISSGTLGGTTGVLTASTYALQGGTIDAVLGTGAITVTTGTTTLGSANRLNSGSTLAINSGQLTLGGAESVAALSGSGGTLALGANTLTTTSNSDTSFAGTITGTGGGLTKAGTGNLVLSGNNSYTGATTVSAGVLNIQNATATGTTAGGISVTSGAALQIQGGITVGAEALTLNGSGVSSDGALRNISGNNTYGGAITLGSNSAIASDADTLTISGAIGGNNTLTILGAGNITLDGVYSSLAGSGLLVGTTGVLTLNAANTFSGNMTISNGATVIAANNAALGSNVSPTTVNSGGTLALSNNISTSENITVSGTGVGGNGVLRNIGGANTNTGVITLGAASTIVSDGGTLTLAGSINGANNALTIGGASNTVVSGAITNSTAGLTKAGAGTVTLSSGANTFTGNVNITTGTLAVTNGGAIAAASLLTIDSGATFSVLGSEGVGRFTGAGTANIASGQILTTSFDSASNNFSGSLAGAGGLTKTGSGTLTLSGNNSGYSGTTTLNNGTFLVGAGGAFGSGGTVTINFDTGTGTRELASADASSYTLNNNFNLFFNSFSLGSANTGSLTLGASTNTFFLGDDGGSTTRTITVTGTQIIGAAVTGGANNNLNKAGSGTLILAGDASALGGTITNSTGRLQIGNGSTTGTLGSKNVTVASSAELAFNRSDNLTYGGAASGAGSVLKLGAGTVTFTAANTYTGATTISNGSLALSGSGALSSSTALNLAVSGANFSISGISGTGTAVASLTGVAGSTVSLGGKALTFGGNNGNSTFAGEMSGTGGSFIKTGTGTVTLSGSNSMTGTAQLNDGTLLIGNNFALGTNSFQIQFDVGGTKTLASDGSTARTLQITNLNLFNNLTLGVASTGTGALTVTGRVYLGDEVGQTRTITTATGTGHTFSGAVTGNRGMVKEGSGTLTLSGANTFGGGLQLNNGTILVGNNAALGTGTMLFDFADGGGTRTLAAVDSSAYTLNNNFNLFFNALTLGQTEGGTGTLTLGASTNTFNLGSDGSPTTRTITVNGTQIIGAAVTGGANNSLNKAGSGTLILAGDASALGGTITNSAGRLQIGNGSTTGTIGNKNVNVASSAELAFNRSDNLSYGGVISGAGSLLKFGAGTLTLSTANTFTGTLTIGAGGLSVSANNNLGGGTAMTISNAAKLLTTASFTSARSLTVGDGGAEINVATNTVFTSTGAVSGSTALTKTGGGTLSLSNASSSYNGTVAVTTGTLQVNGTASSMNVNVTNAGSVLMGAGSIGTVTVNSGTFIAPGNSVGNLLVSELTLQGGGGYNWEINASTGTAGTDWDLITVGGGGGNVAINSSQESPFTIFLQGNPTGWNVASNYSWTIIDAGTLTGFATNAFAVNFGGFTGATPTGTFSFSNVSGNLVMAYAAAANVYNVTVATGAVDQGAGAGITGGTNQFTGDYTLNKLGAGTLVMTNPANDYTGLTTVKEGTIQIDVNAPNNAAGALGTAITAVIIGDSTNNVAAGFNIGVAGVTNDRGLSVVAGTGAADRIIGTTITSGVAEQAGTIAVNTNTTFSAAGGGTLLVSGAVSGAGNITISNGGTNIFSGANTYSGTTTILTNATLTIANNSALGTTGSATTVNDGGTLALSNNISTAENITIAGSGGTNADGAIRNISGANTNSGTITLSANATISADSGTRLSLSNVDITGAANRSVTFDGAGTNLVTGSISTAGGSLTNRIIKSGSGELVISNNGTTGTGQLRLGEGTVVLAAGSLTTSQNTSTRAIDIGLSGDAVGTSTAANATLLARSGVTVSNSIYVAPSGGDGSFTRTIGTDSTSGTVTYNNQMYLGGSVQLTSAGTANLVYSGNITNDSTLNVTKIGAGSLTLSANNTWRGGLIAGEGTTILSGGNAVWDTNAVTVSNNATLALGASETIGSLAGAGTVTLGANSLVTGSNSSSTTYSGVIGGTGGIFKNGTGTFTLAGANTYSGDTIVNGGTLAFSNGSVNSSIIRLGPDNSAGNTTILLSDSDGGTTVSSTLVVQADAGSTRSLVSSNSSGTNTYGGSIYLDGTATISQQAAGVLALTGSEIDVKSRTLTLSSVTNGNVAVSSTIFDSDANTGNIAKTGNGTVTLTGANAYAGTTLISGGTLQVGDGGATGQLGAGNITNNASLVVNRTGAITIGNTISGTGSLTKTGVGTLTLGAINSFAGNVNVTGGAISISDANRLGATNNTLNLDGGTLLSMASVDLGASRTLNIGLAGGTLFTDSGTQLTFNGTITNSSTNSTLTKLGAGTLAVGSGSGVFTGNSVVGQGVLLLTSSNALSQSFVTVSNGAVLTNNFTGSTIEIGDLQGSGTVNVGSNSLTVGSEGNNTTFSGAVNISGNNNFTAVGSGTLTLSGKVSDTQTGSTIVGAGAVQLSGTDNRLSTNAALAVSNGAVLDLNGLGQRVAGLSGAGTITNSPVSSGRLIVDVSSGANTYNGTMQGGMDFEKTGAGTMVLAGNNGFAGAVRVLGGTLSVGADNNFGNATNVVTLSNNTAAVSFSSSFSSSRNFTVATGTTGTLLAGFGVTTTLGGSLSKNGSVLVFGGGGSFIVNGVISGASANSDLVVSNSTVTLNATNTYSGPTYLHTGGTLNLGVNDAMPTDTALYLGTNTTSGTVNLQGYNQTVASLQTQGTAGTNNVITLGGGNLTVNGSSSTTYDGLISGAGSIVKSGTGTLALTAANTYSGSTTISNGTLQVSLIADGGAASSIGTGSTVTMAGSNPTNAVLDYTGGNVTTDRAFVMNDGGGTINMAASTTEMTLTGSASGTGKLIVGEGTLILSNATANSFAPGSIQVDSGATLQLAANNQIGNSTGLILNGGTFRVGTATTGFSDTLGTLTLSASSTIDLGAWTTGVRQLTFANSSAITWTGTLTITNWQGVALQSSDVAEILFGTGGLTSTQLAQVSWANQGISGGTLIGGELVPIPEPRVYAAAVALLAAVGWRERKRLRELLNKGLGKKSATPSV